MFFLNGASNFFYLFFGGLAFLGRPAEAGFQNLENLLALAFLQCNTAAFAVIGRLFSLWGYDVVKTLPQP